MKTALLKIAGLRHAPMPLLGKELIEQSARRRTYVMRVIYGALLFLVFALLLNDRMGNYGNDPLALIGSGRDFFEILVALQFAGIGLFLPAMMSSAITYEKERESLSLLFLTNLGPWEILMQKFLGRLVPMFTFLLLAMPLLAISYSFGGVETRQLTVGVWCIALFAVETGAFSLMMSAFCRTTTAALLASYGFGLLFYLGPVLFVIMMNGSERSPLLLANPVVLFFNETSYGGSAPQIPVWLRSIPILLATFVFLVLARRFLVTRAFVQPKQRLLALFKRQDAFWHRLNKIFGGVILIKDKSEMPEDDPVRWREVTKRPLGKLSYLLRQMLLIEIPLVLLAVGLLYGGFSGESRFAVAVMVFCLWGIAVAAVSVKSAVAFASERTNQTLDVLLTTPLSGEEIVRQKMAGVWRMVAVLMIPFLTLFGLGAAASGVWGRVHYGREEFGYGEYVFYSLATVLVYLPLFAWFSNWIGMKCRTRARAVTATLLGILLWCGLPPFLLVLIDEFGHVPTGESPLSWFYLLSPASFVVVIEGDATGETMLHESGTALAVVNLCWHGFLLFIIRHRCIANADRLLGRAGGPELKPIVATGRETPVT